MTTAPNRKISWWTPQMTGCEVSYLSEAVQSNYLNEGDLALRFEEEIARRLNVRHAVSVTSGTAALYLSLMAFGIGPGDEVLVPDMTFIATANAVSMTGATPVLVDVCSAGLTMAADAADRAITPKTKAVIPVHVSGRSADMPALLKLARQHSLIVIEDAAEALCSKRGDAYLGTIGQCGCFSFSAAKTITTGQGGMIVTNDATVAARLRELKDQGRKARGTGGDDLHPSLGFNFKFTNLQAAVGLAQLTNLDARLARTLKTFTIYQEELDGLPGIDLLPFRTDEGEQPQWTDALVERRDELDQYLKAAGAECRRFWFPLHTHPPYARGAENFPNSTALSRRALWLPSSLQMSDDDVRWVSEQIRGFCRS